MMNSISKRILGIAVLGIFLSVAHGSSAVADSLTYKPKNPAFGGNPFNGPYLLSNATSQRQFQAPERNKPTTSEQFSEAIERSLINRISRDVADQILGENGRESGSFSVGDTNVDFQRQGSEVLINITDAQTQGSTQIKVPLQQF